MHILWRTYELADGQRSLRAELVKSYRDKVSGSPRNKIVCYLGSIRERLINNKVVSAFFWWKVEMKLSRLLLSTGEKESIRAAIGRRIPPTGLTS
jgi:hypothetical protein